MRTEKKLDSTGYNTQLISIEQPLPLVVPIKFVQNSGGIHEKDTIGINFSTRFGFDGSKFISTGKITKTN